MSGLIVARDFALLVRKDAHVQRCLHAHSEIDGTVRPLTARDTVEKVRPWPHRIADMLATLRRQSVRQKVFSLALRGPGARKIKQLLENTVALAA